MLSGGCATEGADAKSLPVWWQAQRIVPARLPSPPFRRRRTWDFVAYTGLRATFFGTGDATNAAVSALFEGRAAIQPTERRANTSPTVVPFSIVPNVHFASVGGSWAIHAGADGTFQSPSLQNPIGDDITWNVPDRFGVLVEGTLIVPQSGNVVFQMTIDDSFVLELDGVVVFQHFGCQPPTTFTSASIPLTAGARSLRIAAADVCGSDFNLTLRAQGAGFAGGILPPTAFGSQ